MACRTLPIVTAALSLAVIAERAQAQASGPAGAGSSIAVKAGDLDLASPKGAQRLYDRIYAAAEAVCGGGPLVTFVAPNPEFMNCRDAAIDAALSRFHSPLVLAHRREIKVNFETASARPSTGGRP